MLDTPMFTTEPRRSRSQSWSRITVHDSLQAVHQNRNVEVQDQSNPEISQSKIGESLREVNPLKFLYCFDFHQHTVFYKQVGTISATDWLATVDQRHLDLSPDPTTPDRQLHEQTPLVNRFEETRSQLPMHSNRTTNDGLRKLGFVELRALRGSVVHLRNLGPAS